jgi:hypothetical protein
VTNARTCFGIEDAVNIQEVRMAKNKAEGARKWFFPDGYLPEVNTEGPMKSHEALMILNTGSKSAHLSLDIYFEDRDPARGIEVEVGAERVLCIRMDHPEQLNGVQIPPLTQYALRIVSDRRVIVQFGRLDATQVNLAYYTTMGYACD